MEIRLILFVLAEWVVGMIVLMSQAVAQAPVAFLVAAVVVWIWMYNTMRETAAVKPINEPVRVRRSTRLAKEMRY